MVSGCAAHSALRCLSKIDQRARRTQRAGRAVLRPRSSRPANAHGSPFCLPSVTAAIVIVGPLVGERWVKRVTHAQLTRSHVAHAFNTRFVVRVARMLHPSPGVVLVVMRAQSTFHSSPYKLTYIPKHHCGTWVNWVRVVSLPKMGLNITHWCILVYSGVYS